MHPVGTMARRRRPVSNADVARAVGERALFLEMNGVACEPRADERAAQVVARLDRPHDRSRGPQSHAAALAVRFHELAERARKYARGIRSELAHAAQ